MKEHASAGDVAGEPFAIPDFRTVIIQRVVPHYRVPLFSRLHAELGWVVATAEQGHAHGLAVTPDDPPWLHRFVFERSPKNQYRAKVPVDLILARLKPDAILAEFTPQMSSTWRLSRDALLRRARHRKLVFWSHGSNMERGFRKPQDIAAQALRLALMMPADAQLCYTEEGAAYLRRRLPGRPSVFVAPNTVDLDIYPGRTIDASDPERPNLLFVGRITADKRVPMLVEAVARARAAIPDLTLTIIGDGPDMAAVKATAATLGAAVSLPGAIYRDEELAPYFQRASLFTYAGSIGLAANHALAYGLPIVMFDDPGEGARHHPEHSYVVDGVTGYRVKPTTVDAFANCLIALFVRGDAPRAALGGSIRRYAAEHLAMDKMVAAFHELDGFLRGQSEVSHA